MRLVDHEQARGLGQLGEHLLAEGGVVEPLGADQQHVDLAGCDPCLDRRPVLDVGGVDGGGLDAGPLGRLDLVAHQRQQRRDDHGRPGAQRAQQGRWPRSRPPTCPTRCAARRARGSARPPAPRSRPTGRRAAGPRASRPAPGGAARPPPARCPPAGERGRRRSRSSRRSWGSVYQVAPTASLPRSLLWTRGSALRRTARAARVTPVPAHVPACEEAGFHRDRAASAPVRDHGPVLVARPRRRSVRTSW